MRKRLTYVAPLQTAKVFAALSLLGSLPFLLLAGLSMMAMAEGQMVPVGMLLVAPFFYALFGFVATLVGAWLYNLVAKYLGGVEFTSVEVGES